MSTKVERILAVAQRLQEKAGTEWMFRPILIQAVQMINDEDFSNGSRSNRKSPTNCGLEAYNILETHFLKLPIKKTDPESGKTLFAFKWKEDEMVFKKDDVVVSPRFFGKTLFTVIGRSSRKTSPYEYIVLDAETGKIDTLDVDKIEYPK